MPTLDELDEHVPAPLEHRHRARCIISNGFVGMVVTDSSEGLGDAWVLAENPVEVKQ